MSDAPLAASCSWPVPTQPTLVADSRTKIPVESRTVRSAIACWLAQLNAVCRVPLTVGIVCVLYLSPRLAPWSSYRKKTATLCSSNTLFKTNTSIFDISALTTRFSKTCIRSSSADEIANVNFFGDDIGRVLQNKINSRINSATVQHSSSQREVKHQNKEKNGKARLKP